MSGSWAVLQLVFPLRSSESTSYFIPKSEEHTAKKYEEAPPENSYRRFIHRRLLCSLYTCLPAEAESSVYHSIVELLRLNLCRLGSHLLTMCLHADVLYAVIMPEAMILY